jgi:non-ribosomal peptide synthase protein (TIGR01720 family)
VPALREQLRGVPGRGLGYGLLRYLSPSPEVRRRLRAMPPAEVIFRYLGQVHVAADEAARFRRVAEPRGDAVCPRGEKRHLLDVAAQVRDGRLHLDIAFSKNLYRRSTIDGIAAAWREALVSLCPETAGAGRGGGSNA